MDAAERRGRRPKDADRGRAEGMRLRALVDRAPEILFTTDADTRVDDLNARFFAYTGLAPGGEPAAAWSKSIHPEDRDALQTAWRRARRAHGAFELPLRLRRADGVHCRYWLVCRPARDPATGHLIWAGYCADASELAEARAAADRAARAKSRFLAMIGHDLRQPFQAMRLFLHILERRPLDDDTRAVAESLAESIRSGEDLLNALLDVAALEGGKLAVQPMSFGIGQLIRRMAGEYAPQASDKGLSFRSLYCRVTVRSDPVHLERILRNLLSNAVRYTERGGVLLGCRRRGRRPLRDPGSPAPARARRAGAAARGRRR